MLSFISLSYHIQHSSNLYNKAYFDTTPLSTKQGIFLQNGNLLHGSVWWGICDDILLAPGGAYSLGQCSVCHLYVPFLLKDDAILIRSTEYKNIRVMQLQVNQHKIATCQKFHHKLLSFCKCHREHFGIIDFTS